MFFYCPRLDRLDDLSLEYLSWTDEAQPYLMLCCITRVYALLAFILANYANKAYDLRYTFEASVDGSCTFSIHFFHTFIAFRLDL